jgi:hypothetical protein
MEVGSIQRNLFNFLTEEMTMPMPKYFPAMNGGTPPQAPTADQIAKFLAEHPAMNGGTPPQAPTAEQIAQFNADHPNLGPLPIDSSHSPVELVGMHQFGHPVDFVLG